MATSSPRSVFPSVTPAAARPPALVLAALFAWIAYLAVGTFPAVPLEGDEQGVITGSIAMAKHATAYLDTRYNFEMQPGSYVVLNTVARLTGADVTALFAILTVAGAAGFAAVGIVLVSRLLAAPWPLVTAAFLLCQEISAAAYYLNTTAMGAALALAAVSLALAPLTPRRGAAAALLLAVAGWIRIDCVLISPALVAVVWMRTRRIDATFRETLPVTLGAIGAMAGLYLLAGANPLGVFSIYAERGTDLGWKNTLLRFPLVTSFLLTGLTLVGLLLAGRARQWPLLLIAGAGTALSFAVYGDFLKSDKYFYLATPFFLLLAVYGALELNRLSRAWPRVARLALWAGGVALLLPDTFLGVLSSEDRYRAFPPRPQIATLVALPRPTRPLYLTVGTGEFVMSADGFRLRAGTFFAPPAWRIAKLEMRDRLSTLAQLLEQPDDCTLFHSGWLPYQIAVRQLLAAGFTFASAEQPQPFPYNGRWTRHGKSVRLDYLAYTASEYFNPQLCATTTTGSATYFIGDQNSYYSITPFADGHVWQVLPGCEHGYITLHRRR